VLNHLGAPGVPGCYGGRERQRGAVCRRHGEPGAPGGLYAAGRGVAGGRRGRGRRAGAVGFFSQRHRPRQRGEMLLLCQVSQTVQFFTLNLLNPCATSE
jgi:hypothetical protein